MDGHVAIVKIVSHIGRDGEWRFRLEPIPWNSSGQPMNSSYVQLNCVFEKWVTHVLLELLLLSDIKVLHLGVSIICLVKKKKKKSTI